MDTHLTSEYTWWHLVLCISLVDKHHRAHILLLGIPYDTRWHISPSYSTSRHTSLCILICSETSKRSIRLSFWSSERKNEHCQQLEPDKWNFQQLSSQLYMWYVRYISVHPHRSRTSQCSSMCNRSALRSFGISLQMCSFLPFFEKKCEATKKVSILTIMRSSVFQELLWKEKVW